MGAYDDMLNELGGLRGKNVSIPVGTDADGNFDRECPADNCHFQFKVLLSDWKELFKNEKVFCPLCRHEAPATEWQTDEQRKHLTQQATGYIGGIIQKHLANVVSEILQGAAHTANRQLPGGGTIITLNVNGPGVPVQHVFVPMVAKEAFTLKVECSQCSAHYAVIGSAFFCPNCGHNSAEQTFDDALKKVGAKLDNLGVIREALATANQLDEGELVVRSLTETALSDCVSALQRLCEELFRRHFPSEAAPFNIFQRLDDANELWRRKLRVGYDNWLSNAQLQEMKVLYQRRHLLAHSEGMVDDKYLQKSQDITYKAGQRIVVKEADVRKLISYVSTIANNLKNSLPS